MTDRKDVYHPGELAVQELAGERELAERHGRGIGSSIPAGGRPFLERQRLIALAAAAGAEVWCSVWFGRPGFVQARDDGRLLHIDRREVAPLELDPVAELLEAGAALGCLAIELETRRRLRINGTLRTASAAELLLEVGESFANCPKYITLRELGGASESPERAAPPAQGTTLDAARVATIGRADTLFVGSLHPERGADASHRGGEPGFVQLVDQQTLRIPDYAGNGMYQTLGNLHTTPRAGLVFVDFDGRRLLHVTGNTELRFDGSQAAVETGGTGRSWLLHVERWLEGALPAGVGARFVERSRYNPKP